MPSILIDLTIITIQDIRSPIFDYHHENFNGNFGLLTLLDRLHGTNSAWRSRLEATTTNNKKKDKP